MQYRAYTRRARDSAANIPKLNNILIPDMMYVLLCYSNFDIGQHKMTIHSELFAMVIKIGFMVGRQRVGLI